MPTDKYDLHEIDYSVQGWDSILATDMEKLDDVIPARVLGTLGETVAAYLALYLKSADGFWYKAQANGTKQPCLGIALQAGDAADEIQIHRLGEIENVAWTWATKGAAIYLDASSAGAMTQTPPGSYVQIVGYALSATVMIATMEGVQASAAVEVLSRGGTVLSPSGAVNVIVWTAPFACTVTAVKGYRVGGTGATINARKNGSSNHLASDLSLTSADTWTDGGAVQNTAYSATDKLEIMIVSVAGSPTQITVQINLTKP